MGKYVGYLIIFGWYFMRKLDINIYQENQQIAGLMLRRSSYHTAILTINLDGQAQRRFKKLLQKLGKPPTYQYLIIIFIILAYALVVFNTMIGSFVFMNPQIQCDGVSSTQEQACQHFDECIVTNNFTAAYKNDLFCDKELIRSTIQSVFGLGYIVGKICFPLIADIIGRRKSILISLLLGVVAMSALLLGIQYGSETLMMGGQLIAGVFGSGIATLSFIYVCDCCTQRVREFCLTNCWAVWGLAQMIFCLLYFFMPGWKFYLSVTLFIPLAAIVILVMYLLIQSPVYALFVKKNPEAFDDIVDQVARFTKITKEQKDQFKQQGRKIVSLVKKGTKNDVHLKQILSKIFCVKKNLKIVICLILTNIGYIFFYFGMQGSMETVGFNFGYSMLFVGITQFFGFLSAGIVTKNVRRKPGIIISTIISSLLGLLFLIDYVKQQPILQTVMVVLSRLAAGYVFCFFVLLESQILEVDIRNTCFALIDGTGQGGRIVAPYVINIMYNLKLHPIIAFSIVFIIMGALPIAFLKETFNKQNVKKSQTGGAPKSVSSDLSGLLRNQSSQYKDVASSKGNSQYKGQQK